MPLEFVLPESIVLEFSYVKCENIFLCELLK